MNTFVSKQVPLGFVNFSETKRNILNDIRARWGKFTEDDLAALVNNDDLVGQIAMRYNIERAKAQADVDAMMQGRQI
jgi:hypothetical protein